METKTPTKLNDANHSTPDPCLREQIEKRAYELWLAGGSCHGNNLDDWLQAEREVLKHHHLDGQRDARLVPQQLGKLVTLREMNQRTKQSPLKANQK
jgi:hypothetical protein